jgi:hypothetical protein
MIRKCIVLVIVILCLAVIGCSNVSNPVIENTSEFWSVEIVKAEVALGLSGNQSQLQYGGTIIEIPLEQLPKDGCLFLILEMTVEKTGTGRSTFSWKDTYITDADGNKYTRHENDTFLNALGFTRLKATDIAFGFSEGYVCYEIPIEAARGNLWFIHESDDGYIKIEINILNKRDIR